MTDAFLRNILRVSVAQICQTIGYHNTQTSAIELLQHVLDKYMIEITRDLKRHVEHYNRGEVNLSDLELTLDCMSINLNGLMEYIENVDAEPFVNDLPFFPVRKQSSLNIPLPDTPELKTRHPCIYKHLPLLRPEEAPPRSSSSIVATITPPSNNLIDNVCNVDVEKKIEPNNASLGNPNNKNVSITLASTTATTTTTATATIIKTELERELAIKTETDTTTTTTQTATAIETVTARESTLASTINNNDLVAQIANTTIDKATFESLFKPNTTTYADDTERDFNNFCEPKAVVMTNEGKIAPAREGIRPNPFIPDFDNLRAKPLKHLKPSSAFNDGFVMPPPPPPQHSTSASLELPRPSSRTALMSLSDVKDNNMDVHENAAVSAKTADGNNKRKLRKEKAMKALENSTMTLSKLHSNEPTTSNMYSSNTSPTKKTAFMANASGAHAYGQNSFATMLLKRAKKQKIPPYTQPHAQHAYDDKQHQHQFADKHIGKANAVEKTQRKCVKMLQKMVKQGKLPFDIVNALITPDKKLKDNLNPAILLAGIPACPEKQQLEKLLRKRAKQRQKLAKQQLLQELNKRAAEQTLLKSTVDPKAITSPIVMHNNAFSNEFAKENILDVSASMQTINSNTLVNTTINSINNQKTDAANNPLDDLLSAHVTMNAKTALDIKFATELDRNKLNIFRKLTKQKNAKSPTCLPGFSDDGVINLPSGTTITPAPAPPAPPASTSTAVTTSITSPQMITQLNNNNNNNNNTSNNKNNNNNNDNNNDNINNTNSNNNNLNHNINNSSNASNNNLVNTLFNNNHNNNSFLVNSGSNYAGVNLQSDDLNKNILITAASGLTQQTNDLSTSYSGRVFGEKTADAVDMTIRPKKRGRKPGSKNNPKLAGDLPLTPTSKKSKKTKYENNLFPPTNLNAAAALPPSASIINANHHSFNSSNPFELNAAREAIRPGGILPMFSMSGENSLQHQIAMANAKERKERKKNKTSKSISNMNNMSNNNNKHSISTGIQQFVTAASSSSSSSSYNINNNLCGNIADAAMITSNIPTNEEVQSINKKLMRMDTTLKPAPMQANDPNSTDATLMATTKFQSSSSTANKLSFSNAATSNNSAELQQNSSSIKSPRSLNESVNHSPFIMPNQHFPHLPGNMLSMLPFPFPPRPGLIPTPGLFPNPNLGAFAVSNTKNNANTNMLLPGLFPFPLKQSNFDNGAKLSDIDTEDLTIENRKSRDSSAALPANERSYCNVAPLVPEFLKLTNSEMNKSSSMVTEHYNYNNDLPRTPKARNSQTSNSNTPDSVNNSFSSNSSNKSIPTTPGGLSLSSYEHLLKKHDSPIEVIPLGPKYPTKQDNNNRHIDNTLRSNLLPMDFGAYKRSPSLVDNKIARIPINADEPIEVSDDSDEMNQNSNCNSINLSHFPANTVSAHPSPRIQLSAFSRDNNFVNTLPSNSKLVSVDSELTAKELKKLKKQVKRASAAPSFCTNLLSADKSADGGVGKLAGGADLIPLSSTGLAYSSQSIPFNSLTGGNSNPTFGSHAKDLLTSKLGSSSSNSMVFDNITITPTLSINTNDTNCILSSAVHDLEGQKKRKEHKKLKKLKELKDGKIKKKKDKKDKTKNKDRAEKYLTNQAAVSTAAMPPLPLPLLPPPATASSTPSKDNNQRQMIEALPAASTKTKIKDLSRKKDKKEKKKDKQRSPLEETNIMLSSPSSSLPTASITAMAMANNKDSMALHAMTTSEFKKSKPANTSNTMLANSIGHQSHLPGLHSPSSNPVASAVPKLTLKLTNTQSPSQSEEISTPVLSSPSVTPSAISTTGITHSAKPSPVRTLREPSPELARISPLVTRPPKHKLNTNNDLVSNGNPTGSNLTSCSTNTSLDLFGDSHKNNSATNVNLVVPPPSPWLSGGTISASSVLLPNQLLQSTKTNELTAGVTAAGSAVHGVDTSRQSTSNSERKSPLTTLIAESSRPSSYIDAEGNRVWICPACGKVDDGSPMIGCDGCDAWYHWICVGIVVAPKDNEDWFCRVCITRRKGVQGNEKKRKRTKKK